MYEPLLNDVVDTTFPRRKKLFIAIGILSALLIVSALFKNDDQIADSLVEIPLGWGEKGEEWTIEIPTGQIPGGERDWPANYATMANPWTTSEEQAHYVSAPLGGDLAQGQKLKITGDPMGGGSFKIGYQCTLAGAPPTENFVIKTMKRWYDVGKAGEKNAIDDIVMDYETQVILSYASWLWSARGGGNKHFKAAAAKLFPDDGKFAYSHPLLVKVTFDGKWTLGLVDHFFLEFFGADGTNADGEKVSKENEARMVAFSEFFEGFTNAKTFPTQPLLATDDQGYWYHESTLYMTDGQLVLPGEDNINAQVALRRASTIFQCAEALAPKISQVMKAQTGTASETAIMLHGFHEEHP